MRKSEARRLRNRVQKKTIKTQIKKVFDIAEGESIEQLQKEFVLATKKLDKAAAKRVIHPNQAAQEIAARPAPQREEGGAGQGLVTGAGYEPSPSLRIITSLAG